MRQSPQQGGASVHVRGRIPSVDLASLVSFLVEALPAREGAPDHVISWPALSYDPGSRRLILNSYGPVRRFIGSRKTREALKQAAGNGFLRDLDSPGKGFTAKMGGRLHQDDFAGVSQGIADLKRLLAEQFESLKVDPQTLLVEAPDAALAQLAKETGAKDFSKELSAQLVAMEFAKPDRPASVREKDVARVLSAEEEIQAEDWLERMADSIAQTQANRDYEFDDIQRDKLVETLRQDFDRSESQVTRFLNFLEDEALARVRLAVSFAIMQALAAQIGKPQDAADKAFIDYVERVITLFKLYGDPEAEDSLDVDLSRDYGLAANFSISGELVKALFYSCLPVWAEWNTQLFESRRIDPTTRGVSVVREVSYRFRVNGPDPRNESLHAFDSRLKRQRETLIDDADEVVHNQFRHCAAISPRSCFCGWY